jgi:tungstate transport system ATP-binding protein
MSPTATIVSRRNAPVPAVTPARVCDASSPLLPLVVDQLSYHARDRRLIDRVSFALQAGARTMVLGANGAGKSLLLRLCHGLLQPGSGSIVWGTYHPADARQWIAMVSQKPVLLRRSVIANVEYALAIKGVSRRARRRRALEALQSAGLDHLAHRSARVLSGGEQQRLAIARAWAPQPQVLLLDEPTANLDPAATYAIETLIQTIHSLGTRIIMTTHDLAQARRLGEEVLFMDKGRLLEQTEAQEFFERPRCAQALAFIEGKLID